MGANRRGTGRPDFWYGSMSDLLPRKPPAHTVYRRSGLWQFYSSKTPPRPFTMCGFCKVPQLETNKGWMYRKHFNSGTPMAGPVTQHACPKCAKDPKKVEPAAIKMAPAPAVMVTSGRRGQRRGGP